MKDLLEMTEHKLMRATLQLSKKITELRSLEKKAFDSDTPTDSIKYLKEINELLEQQLKLERRLRNLSTRENFIKKTNLKKHRYLSTVPYPIWTLSDKLESFLLRKHTVKQKESTDEKIKLLLEAETILSRLIEIYTDLSEKYLAEDKKENSKVFFELCDNPIVDFQIVHRIVASEIESNNKGSDDDESTF